VNGRSLGQVYLRSRLCRTTTVEEIAPLYHLPAEMLEPAFAGAAVHGHLSQLDGRLAITAAGEREVAELVLALRNWLAGALADWGADDPELDRAPPTSRPTSSTGTASRSPDLSGCSHP
jgi:hypothetical protein